MPLSSVAFKNEERRAIPEQIGGTVNSFSDHTRERLCVQYLRDRACQCERCLCHVDRDDHSALCAHYEYRKRLNEPTTRPSKRAPRACDPRDLSDAHGSLPNPIHDFRDLETSIPRATAVYTH